MLMDRFDVSSLSVREFEALCIELLVGLGYRLVHREEPPERGFDFEVEREGERFGVECKIGDRPLTREMLSQLAGNMLLEGTQRGILLTLRPLSKELAQDAARLNIEVMDRARIEEEVRVSAGLQNWIRALRARPEDGQTSLRVISLRLEGFRRFSELTFEPEAEGATLLLGVNGAGKSSVIDALTLALSWYSRRVIAPTFQGLGLNSTDVNTERSFASVEIDTWLMGEERSWATRKSLTGDRGHGASNYGALKEPTEALRKALVERRLDSLPIVARYSVNRAVLDIPQRIQKKHSFDQVAALHNGITGSGRDFRQFFEWFRSREDLENETRIDHPEHVDPQLRAVRQAIEAFLPGFTRLRVRRSPMRMVVSKEGTELRVDQLSDGERCLLALVGDIARRLAIANPGLAEPLKGVGVVLIDEIELHLHPRWQRHVVPKLVETFSGCQFIISTHSPLILTDVRGEAVRILEGGRIFRGVPKTLGRDVNSMLREVMNVPVRPTEGEARLAEISIAIEEGDFTLAQGKLEALRDAWGENDPEVARLSALIAFLAGEL